MTLPYAYPSASGTFCKRARSGALAAVSAVLVASAGATAGCESRGTEIGSPSGAAASTTDAPTANNVSAKTYVSQTVNELLGTAPGDCANPPSALLVDTSARPSIDFVSAFSLAWLGWANLDATRANNPDAGAAADSGAVSTAGLGEKALYDQWQFEVLATKTVSDAAIGSRVGGAKYTLLRKSGALFLTFGHAKDVTTWINGTTYLASTDTSATFALGASDVHAGFYGALNAMWADILAQIARADAGRDTPIFVTGHSFGAALASLASAGLAKDGRMVRGVYLSGAPKVAGAAWSAAAASLSVRGANAAKSTLADVTFKVTNAFDPLGHIPPDEAARGPIETLSGFVQPSAVQGDPVLFQLATQFSTVTSLVLDRAVGGEIISFANYGAANNLSASGALAGASELLEQSDVDYWSTLSAGVGGQATDGDKTSTFAHALGNHFVDGGDGYACAMLHYLANAYQVKTP